MTLFLNIVAVPVCVFIVTHHNNLLTVILDKSHWMLYFLVTAMFPRFLITLDSDLKDFPVTVRVGQVRLNILETLVMLITFRERLLTS